MNVKECYEKMGGDYSAIYTALQNEALIGRLLKMLVADKSVPSLKEAIEKGNAEEAFRAVHTLKGVSLNLHITPLSDAAIALTEILRPRTLVGYEEAYQRVLDVFEATCHAIAELD